MNDLRGRAQWFGPATPATGVAVEFRLDDTRLVWNDAAGERVIALGAVTIVRGGFDGTRLALSWSDTAGESRLQLSPDAVRALMAAPPPVLAAQVQSLAVAMRAQTRRFRIGASIAVLLVTAPLLLLFVFWLYADRIAEFVVGQISIEIERKLGDTWFEQMRPSLQFVERGPAVNAINTIGVKLERAATLPYPLHWYVVQDPAINAFAAPGGYIVVYTGLIDAADTAEEVAGVLAHELQHIAQRHSLKALVRDTGWGLAWQLAIGDVGGIGNLAQQMTGLQFSRQQELQADRGGLALLQQAHINPRGMIRFFEKLARDDQQQIALLASHPASIERQRILEAALDRTSEEFPALMIDWQKVKKPRITLKQ